MDTLDVTKFHFNAKVFLCKLYGFDDGYVGIALTAAGAANLTDCTKC